MGLVRSLIRSLGIEVMIAAIGGIKDTVKCITCKSIQLHIQRWIMLVEDIKKYCMSKHKVCEEYPFGDVPICYKLNGKVFAQIYPYPEDYKITLKCTVDAGQFYRMVYPGKVVRGYHCPPVQQPYWNTIYLDNFPDEELLNMIDHAYETVFNSFSKKVQKQILEDA